MHRSRCGPSPSASRCCSRRPGRRPPGDTAGTPNNLDPVEQPPVAGPDDDPQVGEDPDRGVKGPHGWLNWLAARAGQPARTDSHTDGALLIPLWQEYGLYSDTWLTSDLVLGPARFTLAFPGEDSRTGYAQMVLVLRIDGHLAESAYDPEGWKTEDVAGYHGGGIDDEFASLLALALGRRLRAGGVIRHLFSGGDPAGSPFYGWHRAPQLAAPVRGQSLLPGISESVDLSQASPLMDAYAHLSGEDAVTVVRAATQYADALWWADLDPRYSWIKLVGALEIAAKHWSDAQNLTRLERFKKHMGLTYKGLKDQHGKAVADSVAEQWDENAGATSRFVEFTVANAPDPPVARPSDADAQLDWSSLHTALRIIYDWRSRDLHEGIPFPAPMRAPPPGTGGDVAPERFTALAASQEGGSWPAERMPMYLHVFEFVARQALLNWWGALPDAGLLAASDDDASDGTDSD